MATNQNQTGLTAEETSASHVRRIVEAIAECDRYIAKEEPRDASLRPADVAKRLEFYKAHRAKLVTMLEPKA